MAAPPITREEAARTIAVFEQCLTEGFSPVGGVDNKGAKAESAARLGITPATLRHRLEQARVRYGIRPDLTKYQPEGRPAAVPDELRTVAEDIALVRARAARMASDAALKEARERVVQLEDELERYRGLVEMNPRPAEWTRAPAASGGGSEHMPYLLTSDHQIGEVIRAEETDAGDSYDVATYRRRYRALIETTIKLCHEHSAQWRFPGIIYARGGDTISGGIHEELQDTDEVTAIEAVQIAFEEEAAGIAHLAEAFGRVEVKNVGGGGNHDRSTPKPRSKGVAAHSYDTLVAFMLRREFRTDERVTFQGTESPDVRFPIYDRKILLTHGDRIGSRGGHGFVGPAATILRGAQKILMEQQALGYSIDEVHMGHFHTGLDAGWAVCNGCLPGFSEFAKMNRMRPEPPMQLLMFYHPVHGRVQTKRIFLEPPRKVSL